MKLFRKRETLLENIAFMAIMASLNVLCMLLTTFVPFLLFLLVFLLPLSCTLVVLFCKKRYFIIYALATIGLCMIVTMFNIADTIFYIIPAMITGFVFAIFIESKIPYMWSIIVATFIQFALSYLELFLIKQIVDIDMLNVFATLCSIDTYEYLPFVENSAVFLVSFIQELLSFLFLRFALKRLTISVESNKENTFFLLIGLLFNLLLTLLSVFLFKTFVFVFLMSSLYFTVFAIIWLIKTGRKVNWILLIVLFVVMIFVFALLYPLVAAPFGLLLCEIYFYIVGLITLINNCLVKNK